MLKVATQAKHPFMSQAGSYVSNTEEGSLVLPCLCSTSSIRLQSPWRSPSSLQILLHTYMHAYLHTYKINQNEKYIHN